MPAMFSASNGRRICDTAPKPILAIAVLTAVRISLDGPLDSVTLKDTRYTKIKQFSTRLRYVWNKIHCPFIEAS